MYESKPYYYGTGRRKHSVARVRVYPGSGVITVNGRGIDDYFGLETLKLIVRQPLAATETADKFDVIVNVRGGGVCPDIRNVTFYICKIDETIWKSTCLMETSGRCFLCQK